MAQTQTLSVAWSDGSELVSGQNSDSDTIAIKLDIDVTAGQTNKQVDVALDVSEMQILLISSDVDAVIKTNSTGSPDATVTIAGGGTIPWCLAWGSTNPFGSTDVSKLYVTNSDPDTAGTVKVRTLLGP